jgi:serine O-acetyltransferase
MLLKRRQGGRFYIPLYIVTLILSRLLSGALGCSVPFSATIGKCVKFQHGLFGVFISSEAVIGDHCIILHQVTVGSNYGSEEALKAPELGVNVFVGVGAKIIGGVVIGDNSKVGANATVIKSFPNDSIIVSPAATQLS